MIPLSDLLIDHQEFHSDLQMDSFITTRNGGTLYGCYKQALRELAARVRALRERYYGIELLELEISEHEQKNMPRDRILARQKRAALPELEHALEHTEREFIRFYGQCLAIREQLELNGVAFPLDATTRHRLDCEMWVHYLKCQAAIAGFCNGRPSNTTLELIQSLPPEIRREVCAEIFSDGAPARLLDWFLTYECQIPAPKTIAAIDARKVVGCCA
jgi:hypothetical protein